MDRKINFKKLYEGAHAPTKSNTTDAGYDLYASHGTILQKHGHKLIKTGISMAIPEGYVGLIVGIAFARLDVRQRR